MRRFVVLALMILACSVPAMADIQLVPDLASGQPVGTIINWTVTATGIDPMDYRLSIAPTGETLRIMYDFSPTNVFEWAPIEEREYRLLATARNLTTGETMQATRFFSVTSRAGAGPVATHIDHALVALYSAPACSEGHEMRVLFRSVLAQPGFSATSFKPCTGQHSMNFYVGGMRERTRYTMRHQVVNESGSTVELGPKVQFLTQAIPVPQPSFTVEDPADATASLVESVIVQTPSAVAAPLDPDTPAYPMAADLTGRMVWYYIRHKDLMPAIFRPLPGGTFLTVRENDLGTGRDLLAEIDLAGHVLRETNAQRIEEQLFAMGFTDIFTGLHHEARLLPNGQIVVFGYTERIVEDVQGPGPVDVLGDYVVALDEDFQVVWAWNSFDQLDLSRRAVLNEKCPGIGCPRDLFLAEEANDWLHSNSIDYSPVDGSLLVSVRNQDWLIKVDYQDGTGSGAVLWRLGAEGDFSLSSGGTFPFQSHQHDGNFLNTFDGIVVFDNGNTRCRLDPSLCFSRGQVYSIDETNMTATLLLSEDLGSYSVGVGSAQELLNGNFFFNSGLQFELGAGEFATSQELLPDGSQNFKLRTSYSLYRTFRLRSLYDPIYAQ
ncbi:MAG: aryl-sulfate sulfotransferase [Acidobacteriota bacterium]